MWCLITALWVFFLHNFDYLLLSWMIFHSKKKPPAICLIIVFWCPGNKKSYKLFSASFGVFLYKHIHTHLNMTMKLSKMTWFDMFFFLRKPVRQNKTTFFIKIWLKGVKMSSISCSILDFYINIYIYIVFRTYNPFFFLLR